MNSKFVLLESWVRKMQINIKKKNKKKTSEIGAESV